MPECDDCGTTVRHVWRHRRFENETHRTVRWVCPSCHPDLASELTTVLDETADPAIERTGSRATATEVRTDGGRSAGVATATGTDTEPAGLTVTDDDASERFDCPVCAGETINGQGMYDCLDCGWTGPR